MILRSLCFIAIVITPSVSAEDLPRLLSAFDLDAFFPGGVRVWTAVRTEEDGDGTLVKWQDKRGQEIEVIARKVTHRTIDTVYRGLGSKLDIAIGSEGGNILVNQKYFGKAVTKAGGDFIKLHILAGTPSAVYWWKYRTRSKRQKELETFSNQLTILVRKLQYEQAYALGNVMMGAWAEPVHEYARLLTDNDNTKSEKAKIYRQLLEVNSSNYEAHVEYMLITSDRQRALQSAKIVRRNAENAELITAAARFIGGDLTSLDLPQRLGNKDNGLRLVLVPLPPYNAWILQEVADIYESMTKIPVSIRSLSESWQLPPSSRSINRPLLERLASSLWPDISDFSAWSLEKLRTKIMSRAKKEGLKAVADVKELFKKIDNEGGQWDATPLINWLAEKLAPYTSKSPSTMYVGITGIDIYSGDAGFIFSTYGGYPQTPVSLLSYARMSASTTRERQSRKRLVERIAKELVPASLKQLKIPRSLDPSCPYSYANGLARVDEKTLTLSDSVRTRIAEIKRRNQI